MIYLVGSIVCSTYLTLFFKLAQRFGWSTMQVIVSNYITCVITGSIIRQQLPLKSSLYADWFGWALAMGTSFILLFNVIGFSAQRIGVAVTVTAYKLSLVIPFLFSVYLYNEGVDIARIAGVLLALAAVVFTSYRNSSIENKTALPKLLLIIVPAVIFIWSGLLDTAIKFVESRFLNTNNNDEYLVTAFATAACIGIAILSFIIISGREKLSMRSLAAGVALGIPNYFSIRFLIKVLKINPGKSAVILTVNNIAVVLLSAFAAGVIFKERLSLLNWLGIALAAISILLISGILMR
ncbi:MAG: hypothetical protein QM668_01230 [Agriterribacter sp.]